MQIYRSTNKQNARKQTYKCIRNATQSIYKQQKMRVQGVNCYPKDIQILYFLKLPKESPKLLID